MESNGHNAEYNEHREKFGTNDCDTSIMESNGHEEYNEHSATFKKECKEHREKLNEHSETFKTEFREHKEKLGTSIREFGKQTKEHKEKIQDEFAEHTESISNKINSAITRIFFYIGLKVATYPKRTIVIALLLGAAFSSGLALRKTESRQEKLWVPQNTRAEREDTQFNVDYLPESRYSSILVSSDDCNYPNVLAKASLESAMTLHLQIEAAKSTYEEKDYTLADLCTPFHASCDDSTGGSDVCSCFLQGILGEWNYNLTTLQNDNDYIATLNKYGNNKEDLIEALGDARVNDNGEVIFAKAFRISYLLRNNGELDDPIPEAWEEEVFLRTVRSKEVDIDYPGLTLNYIAARSFGDEFGNAIGGDLISVQISFIVSFIFVGATLGRFCGSGSRWAVSLCAIILVALSTAAAMGLASFFGIFSGPLNTLLPFVLLGIGLDDVFVIVNAFNRERNISRVDEDNDQLIERSAKATARSGASITVTSLTDMVAFAISSTSALPALSSFCAYATLGVLFLWLLAATFLVAVVVQDEKRQRANKFDVFCCFKRDGEIPADGGFQENFISRYFRNYHAPAILKTVWNKIGVLVVFAGLFSYGVYGATQLSVEDSGRNFIQDDSYINNFVSAGDQFFSSGATSIGLFVVFQNGQEIYRKRSSLAQLRDRVSGLSTEPPYIAEPNSAETYRNVMTGLAAYLGTEEGKNKIEEEGIPLEDDNWPTTYPDFITTLRFYTTKTVDGRQFSRDINFIDNDDDETDITIRVYLSYINLTKESRGKTLDDAERQIKAMDATRDLVDKWGRESELPPAYVYSGKFFSIEGFKIIRHELFQNAGLALLAVGIITLLSLGNGAIAFIITLNVAFCITEILGFMFAAGLVIDSITVVSVVLAVGLSVDYSAHVGHCFMVKRGDRNTRATEALADIGASVLNGAATTFLAVVVLLFSTTYVFQTIATQFALTVTFGVGHGLILLPVLLSIFGPEPYKSAAECDNSSIIDEENISYNLASICENSSPEDTEDKSYTSAAKDEEDMPYNSAAEYKNLLEDGETKPHNSAAECDGSSIEHEEDKTSNSVATYHSSIEDVEDKPSKPEGEYKLSGLSKRKDEEDKRIPSEVVYPWAVKHEENKPFISDEEGELSNSVVEFDNSKVEDQEDKVKDEEDKYGPLSGLFNRVSAAGSGRLV